ncbi:MAG: amidohydrolase [Christensenellales bacterium]|jgi:imidazolonepropionase-like amidohydrolase
MLIIKNGRLHNAVHPDPFSADILVKDGKILRIAQNIQEEGAEIVDAAGLDVYPGFVEAHCHIGLDGYGIGYEGQDYNEYTDAMTPHLRAIDGIEPTDPTFLQAARAGVTTVCTGPGSSNVVGGMFAVIKTIGDRVDDMVVKFPAAMKVAFGENPKRCYRDKSITSRMSTAAKLRELLFKAKEYGKKQNELLVKAPDYDIKLEAMLPVIRGEIPLKAHAHRLDDIFTAIRIANEFGVKLTLEHCTEGHLAPEKVVSAGYPLAVGPSLTHASKFELRNKTFATPGILAKAGGRVSIITDSPVIPQQYLPLCAGLAVKDGMDSFQALQAITINPALQIGVSDRVGSLEEGKDADIVLAFGSPLGSESAVKAVFIDGKPVAI